MSFRKIDVDDEVFAFLEGVARAFVETTPNDVLRRLLLVDEVKRTSGVVGVLKPFIDAGKLKPGDILTHNQSRKRRTFRAEVTSDGLVQIKDGRQFTTPSPALKAYVGYQVDGWKNWFVERLNCSLKELQ
jgi:hypothetical protein